MNPLVTTRFAQSHIKIRCERRLLRPGETTVRVGNTVSPNQVIARMPEQVQYYIVPGNELLGVQPAAITDYLLVDIGQTVELGAPLLQKKSLFGSKTVKAPVAGKVSAVQNGRIIMESIAHLVELRAMVKGRVTNFVGDRTIIVETQGTLIQGLWGSGVETFGPLKVTAEQPGQPLTAGDLNKHENNILATGTIQDEAILEQAAFEEIPGLIVGTMSARLCDMAHQLQLPLILTDGISSHDSGESGPHYMSQPLFDLLRQWDGHETSLLMSADSHHKPEIIIPHQTTTGQIQPPAYQPLTKGQTVRLLRTPYKGQLGRVITLLNTARPTATGIKTYGAMIALADEQTVFVPYTNMEAIL
jgi:hypothetical protein